MSYALYHNNYFKKSWKQKIFGKNKIFCSEKGCFHRTKYGVSASETTEFKWKYCKNHSKKGDEDLQQILKLHNHVRFMDNINFAY